MGKEGQTVPEMSDEWVQTISNRYIELFEKVTGEPFKPEALSDEETYNRILKGLKELNT
jgi:phosphoribosylaminoimidazole-succinocarboxamide synthase